MPEILITTSPFGEGDAAALELLTRNNISYKLNPLKRRLSEQEIASLIGSYEVVIAGTEPVTASVLDRAPQLKLLAHTGIGLDNIDLGAARARGIAVTYTPSAPSPAVAELVIGQMIALLRKSACADRRLRQGSWNRIIGRRLANMTVGVIGVGRVGRLVVQHLQGFKPRRILLNDLAVDDDYARQNGCEWAAKETIFRAADIITLHIPLTPQTRRLIGPSELHSMKPGAVLINTSRGPIVDEAALTNALRERPDFSAAIDVFEEEPYKGELAGLENCLLSCHMGSCTDDCRLEMETQAAKEVIRYFRGEPFAMPVPDSEYALQAEM
ncbi:MAG TPA: phosphoglycerate dehydrogenase [Terriglobia bacterium]|jgi:D-3-phosphoglycerate dehydrogenase